jgi:hypothetical protein
LHRGIVRYRSGCYFRSDFRTALFDFITKCSDGRSEASQNSLPQIALSPQAALYSQFEIS